VCVHTQSILELKWVVDSLAGIWKSIFRAYLGLAYGTNTSAISSLDKLMETDLCLLNIFSIYDIRSHVKSASLSCLFKHVGIFRNSTNGHRDGHPDLIATTFSIKKYHTIIFVPSIYVFI